MKHRILLILMLLAAALTASANYFSVDGIGYTTYGNEATVTDARDSDLIIPETVTYEGVTYTVTSIGEQAFKDRSHITSVTIPKTITSIKSNAFYHCTSLISVKIDDAPVSIGLQAFASCTNLTNVDLGNSVTSLLQGAFVYCSKLPIIEIPNSVTSIGLYAFGTCTNLTQLRIPASVRFIDKEAFQGCSNLIRITVDNDNPYYDSRNNCNALIETATNTLIIGCKYTSIPNTVTTINDYAFAGCSMRKVNIPNSVTTIGNNAFSDCKALTDVTIGDSVTSIGECAFHQCSNLKHVTFGNSLTTIGRLAFINCSSLRSLTFPNTLTSIGDCAFQSCDGLVDLTINSDVTIGDMAFSGYMNYLTNFTIGESVTSLDPSKFGLSGSSIRNVTCHATTPPTCSSGFDYYIYEMATLYVPEESISAYENADYWKDFYWITSVTNKPEDPSGCEYFSIDGFQYVLTYDNDDPMYAGSATIISRDLVPDDESEYGYREYQIQYEDWNTDSIFHMPSEIESEFGLFKLTTILGGFNGACDLKSVVIPSTVTFLGSSAFANSSLESICFSNANSAYACDPISFGGETSEELNDYFSYGDNGYDDGNSIFSNCKRLSTVVFERPIDRLPAYTFMNCPQLRGVYFSDSFNPYTIAIDTIGYCAFHSCDSLTDFIIPNSVMAIAPGAFAHCHNLKNINLPESITSIGDYAFAECYQLDDIILNRALQHIGEGAFLNCWSLSSISIPDDITTIKASTFYDCRNLTDLDLNHVSIFEERAFAGCNKLTSIDLTKAQSIGKNAFFGGEARCSIWPCLEWGLPELSICYRSEAWYHPEINYNLGSFKIITLGEDVSIINDQTFVGHIPDTITCMAPTPPVYSRTDDCDWVFSREAYSNSILCVPKVLVNDYRNAYGWKRFTHIEGLTIMGNGDVDEDGQITVSDITALISKLLGDQVAEFNSINADVDGDGELSISDITILINMLLDSN